MKPYSNDNDNNLFCILNDSMALIKRLHKHYYNFEWKLCLYIVSGKTYKNHSRHAGCWVFATPKLIQEVQYIMLKIKTYCVSKTFKLENFKLKLFSIILYVYVRTYKCGVISCSVELPKAIALASTD